MAANNPEVEDASNDSNDSGCVALFTLPLDVSLEVGAIRYPDRIPGCSSFNPREMRRRRTRLRLQSARAYGIPEAKERKLRLAASVCNIEALTRLLEEGTNPNCTDEYNRSPLHLAACRGYTTIVSELLMYGASPNVVDSLGNTPLHLAVISASSNSFNRVVRILLHSGASVHITDRNGKNPLELAESKLRLMRSRYINPTPELSKVIEDMCLLIALILKHFCMERHDIEDFAALEKRLQNMIAKNQVASEADTLLASIERLSISK